MFSPSANVLANRVDIYRLTNAQDADGGYTPTYTLYRSGVPCTVQQDGGDEYVDDSTANRITQVNVYLVIFGTNPNVNPRDKFVWRDGGSTHTLFVKSSENCAGRGSAWAVKAIERQ